MDYHRPDLSDADPDIRAYIEFLEAEITRLQSRERVERKRDRTSERGRERAFEEEGEDLLDEAALPPLETTEPPTTLNVITISASGFAKRTPRHLYPRQRRGGMGIFDLETGEKDPPVVLAVAEESQSLLVFTSLARAFRIPVRSLPEEQVRGRGQYLLGRTPLLPDEIMVAALPDLVKGSIAMVSRRGLVRSLRHHVFGEYMKPGTVLFDVKNFGPLAAACQTPGDGDLFIASRQGRAIRFSEKLVPPQGGPGMRLEEGDEAVGITAVYQESSIFLIGADGRGTLRAMAGFNPNKSAGGSGKIAMNTDHLAGVFTAADEDDLFLISHLSKIIRFMAAEVPVKEGPVQGVFCMALRGDRVVSGVVTPTNPT
jgi:DNA gyrase subunit A